MNFLCLYTILNLHFWRSRKSRMGFRTRGILWTWTLSPLQYRYYLAHDILNIYYQLTFTYFNRQELLKMYQITPNAENEIWNRFPTQTQSLMTPMLSSRYKVQAPKRETWPEVIFGSKEASTYVGWASLWARKLTSFCKDDRAVFLFKVCEPSLKRDSRVLLFFLQYILRK